MQRFYFPFTLVVLLLGGLSWQGIAQSETDAYRLTQRELNGSARYTAMAGAFTALGGDLSAIEKNPASIGVFHKSQLAITGQVIGQNTASTWFGSYSKDNSTQVRFGQIGFVGSFFNPRKGNGVSMAINLSYPYRIHRQINSRNAMPQSYSLADYVASTTPDNLTTGDLAQKDLYDPYREPIPWFSVLGFNAGWIAPTNKTKGPFETSFYYPLPTDQPLGPNDPVPYGPYGPASSGLQYSESATISETDFALSYNYQDRLYAGLSLKVTNVDYRLSTNYDESFMDGDYLTLDNELRTTGRGFGGSLGIIGRPTEHLRLGIAYHTPSILYFSDLFDAKASSRYSHAVDENGNFFPEDMWTMRSRTPEASMAKYELLSPSRITFGVAYTFGQRGLLSVDYEMIPLGGMKLYDANGQAYTFDNSHIRKHYALQQSVSVGGEVMVIPKLALRAGYRYQSPAMKKEATATYAPDDPKANHMESMKEQILVAGTLPHFMIYGDTHTITCGLGYHFTKRTSLNAAFLYNIRQDKLYAFPTLTNNLGDPVVQSPRAIDVNQKNYRFYLTLVVNI